MRTPVTVAAVCAALLVTARCGGSNGHQAGTKPPGAAPSTETPKPAPPTPPPPTGKMVARYDDAETPEAQHGRPAHGGRKIPGGCHSAG
jgi:hypothetical protein